MAETIFGIIFNRLFKIVRLRALTNHLVPGKGMVFVNIPPGAQGVIRMQAWYLHAKNKSGCRLLNVQNSVSGLNTRPEFDFYLLKYKFV